MPVHSGYAALLEDLLAPLGPIVIKRMFGGAGVYCNGIFFAIIDGETLYFKTDAASRSLFEAENMAPFTYMTKDGPAMLATYYRVPERLLDEPDEMLAWAERAVLAAKAGAAAKKTGRRRDTPKPGNGRTMGRTTSRRGGKQPPRG